MSIRRFHLVDEQHVGDGGFLRLRRVRVRVETDDGAISDTGLYDMVERPVGLDAVVLVLFSRDANGAVEVLLRAGVRLPLIFSRDDTQREPPQTLVEVVAGLIERGDDIHERAAAEAWEEAGLRIDPSQVQRLGPPMFPTAGLCAEKFHFLVCEVSAEARANMHPPEGDGSPFELGARLLWLPLDTALAQIAAGELPDLKTEVALRRLREHENRW